jgi:hypothetical protein
LAELCAGVPEPPPPRTGRRPVAIADRIFACAFKVYCGLSTRRYVCDMQDAHDASYLTRPVHYSKVCAFLCDPDLTGPLRELVARSVLPLRAVETDFAVDSTGFTTSRCVRWFDHKYGVTRQEHDWVTRWFGAKYGVIRWQADWVKALIGHRGPGCISGQGTSPPFAHRAVAPAGMSPTSLNCRGGW